MSQIQAKWREGDNKESSRKKGTLGPSVWGEGKEIQGKRNSRSQRHRRLAVHHVQRSGKEQSGGRR
jgi:hypothetical protein